MEKVGFLGASDQTFSMIIRIRGVRGVSVCDSGGPRGGHGAGAAGTVVAMRTSLVFTEPARVAGRVEA